MLDIYISQVVKGAGRVSRSFSYLFARVYLYKHTKTAQNLCL